MRIARGEYGLGDREPDGVDRRVDPPVAALLAEDLGPRCEIDHQGGAATARAAPFRKGDRIRGSIARHIRHLGREPQQRVTFGRKRDAPHGAPGEAAVLEAPPGGDPSILAEGILTRHAPRDHDRISRGRGRLPVSRDLGTDRDQRGRRDIV